MNGTSCSPAANPDREHSRAYAKTQTQNTIDTTKNINRNYRFICNILTNAVYLLRPGQCVCRGGEIVFALYTVELRLCAGGKYQLLVSCPPRPVLPHCCLVSQTSPARPSAPTAGSSLHSGPPSGAVTIRQFIWYFGVSSY